ncbi:hypothetical protein BH09MYX1_BH09MYX1_55040 [soil metagenome]
MKKHLLAVLTLAAVPMIAAACSSTPDAYPTTENAGAATLHNGTIVVPQSLADVAKVEADKVTFPSSAIMAMGMPVKGQILVSDRQLPGTSGKNPDGFLRKVVSSAQAGSDIVVTTTNAMLQEAVDDLDVQATLQVPALNVDGPATQSAGITTMKNGGTTIKLLDYSGTKLVDYSADVTLPNQKTIGFKAFATVEKGTLTFSPSYDVGIKLGLLKVRKAHAIAKGQLDAEILIDAGVKLDTTLDSQSFTLLVAQQLLKSQSTRVADYKIDLGSIKAGPISLPASAQFTADLACEFAWGGGVEVKTGATASASITAGVKYENGKFTGVFDKNATFSRLGPDFVVDGAVRARCTITPKFTLNFFGLAMGEVTAQAYAGFGGALTCGGKDANGNSLGLLHGDAEAGANAKVLAKIDLLGLYKWQKECTLFDVSATGQWDRSFVLPGGSQATCTPASNYNLPPAPPVMPAKCFEDETPVANDGGGAPIIPGTCTHDTCTAGEKLGQACDTCTMAVCAADPYCCDTYWGLSCFANVEKLCGKKCQ